MCRLLSEPFPRRMTIKPSVALSPAHITLPPDECSGSAPLTADMSKHTPASSQSERRNGTPQRRRGRGSDVRYLLWHRFRHLPDRPRPSAVFFTWRQQCKCASGRVGSPSQDLKGKVTVCFPVRIPSQLWDLIGFSMRRKKKWIFFCCCCFYAHAFIPFFL